MDLIVFKKNVYGVGGPVGHKQCCKNATQDVVCVIKIQHKIW